MESVEQRVAAVEEAVKQLTLAVGLLADIAGELDAQEAVNAAQEAQGK